MLDFSRLLFLCILICQIDSWCLRSKLREGQSGAVRAVQFSPKSSDFVAIARTDNINIYNQTTLELLGSIKPSGSETVDSISFSKVNNYFAIGYRNQNYIRVFSTSSFPFVPRPYSPLNIGQRGYGMDFRDDGTRLLVCGDSGDTVVVSSLSGSSSQNNGNYNGGSSPAEDCQYSPTNLLGTAFSSKVLGITGGGTQSINYTRNCDSIDFNPNNGNAIVGCADSKGYDVSAGNQVGPLFYTDTAAINAVAYAPDGSVFFMGGLSKVAALFYSNKTLMAKFTLDSAITSGRFDLNSEKLLIGTTGGYVYLFLKDCKMKCQPSYFLTTTDTCKLCHEQIPFCTECTPTACLICFTGYVLSAGSCVKCTQPGCLQCTADNLLCLVCQMGHFMNSTTSKCQRCVSYIPYCLSCTNSTNCTNCDSISYYDSTTGKCKLCNTMTNRCQTCSLLDKCLSCEIGFYLTSTYTCDRCPTNCVACNRTTECQQCASGYYISAAAGPYAANNNCIKCSTVGCVTCDNKNVCLDCQEGKYLDSATKTCIQCTPPCSICNSTAKCFACMNGFYLSAAGTCIICDAGCETCNQTTKCLTCYEGYALDATKKCVQCSILYGNCSICTSSACLLCRQGFYYDTVTSTCLNCLKSITNCMICKDATTCIECSIGYYETGLAGNLACAQCSLGCAKCISSLSCQSCLSTFYFSTGQCLSCVAPCITCLDLATCLSCGNGYYLDIATKTCKICFTAIPNCLDCYNSTYCVGCKPGHYLNTLKTACVLCPSNCTSCSNASYCHNCQIGYYLDSTTKSCLQCKLQCATCSTLGVCQKCIAGYYLDTSDFNCKKCSLTNCLQCPSALECQQCTSGFFIDSVVTSPTYKQCVKCSSAVGNCMLCNDLKQCTLCFYGYGLATNRLSCLSCASAIMGCVNCQKLSSCLACQPQFYLTDINSDGLNECTACGKGCRTCKTSSTCESCLQGYFMDATSKCVTCQQAIVGCGLCDNSTGTVQCLDCGKEYYKLSPTQCSLCSDAIDGCIYCKDQLNCLLCDTGFYLDQVLSQCKLCSNALDGCQLCSSSGICLECQNGYFLDTVSKTCKKCTTSLFACLSCFNQTYCALCQQQTYLSPTTHTCINCSNDLFGCISCTSSSICIQCDSGFYLDSTTNKCSKCQVPGCEICYESDPLKCVTCNSLYVINPTTKTCQQCHALTPGCFQCENTTGTVACIQCMVGYYKNSTNQCQLCSLSQGCVRCSDQTHCIQCESLYYLSSNSTHSFCTLCSTPIAHCDICTSPAQCTQCSASYFLSPTNQSCQFCSQYIPNCIYCESESTCILCDSEYFVSGGECKKCSSLLTGCYSCLSATQCTACKNGYVYDGNTTTCKTLTLMSPQPPVDSLKLKCYYESKQRLRHVLFSSGAKFNKSASQVTSLMKQVSLTLQDKSLQSYTLIISSWQLSSDHYSMVFYTNNPLNFSQLLEKNSSQYKMKFRRLLFQELSELNIDTSLQVPKEAAQQLLPEMDYNSDVAVSYNLNQPEFYNSLMQNSEFFQCKYYLFGYIVLSLLLVNFGIKLIFTAKRSQNTGQIIPHIVAIKTVAFAVYPGYYQMISFSKGFMLYDIPWANQFFGSSLGSPFDYIPAGYKLFYTNLNIASMFFIPLILIIALIIVKKVILKSKEHYSSTEEQVKSEDSSLQKINKVLNLEDRKQLQDSSFTSFWTNIFGFTIVQVSVCSFIGAIDTQFPTFGINFLFYLLGSVIFFSLLLRTIYLSYCNYYQHSNHLRVFLKSVILSLSYIAPVYMVLVAFLVDLALLVVEYLRSLYGRQDKTQNMKKLFYINQFLADITLLLVFLINTRLIAIILAVIFISLNILVQLILHYKEYKQQSSAAKRAKLSNLSNSVFMESQQLQSKHNDFPVSQTKQSLNQSTLYNETVVTRETRNKNRTVSKSLSRSRESKSLKRSDKSSGFFNDI